MVELNEDELPILVGKACALRERLSCEIKEIKRITYGLCRSCRVQGQCVRVSSNESSYDEDKVRLVGIRDSIRDVGDMLSSLQKLEARHRKRKEATEMSLEESRLRVMELLKLHHGTRTLQLMREMKAAFGERLSTPSKRNDEGNVYGRKRKLGPRSILRWMIRILQIRVFNPIIEWERSMWVGARLIVLSLGISAFVMGRRRLEDGGEDLSRCVIINDTLDILRGRG